MTRHPWSKLRRKTHSIATLKIIARRSEQLYAWCGIVYRIKRGRRHIRHQRKISN